MRSKISLRNNSVEGKELSTAKSIHELSSRQIKNIKPHGKLLSEDESTVCLDMNHISMTIYGCGICDEMFQIEKEFMEHCERHYCENPQKDTFLELFEIRLLSYSV